MSTFAETMVVGALFGSFVWISIIGMALMDIEKSLRRIAARKSDEK